MRLIRIVTSQIAIVFAAILIVIAADRVLGWYAPSLPLSAVLFPAGATTTVSTPEFTYTAVVNDLGFRDRPFSIARNTAYRIAVIGDSFTYGWGVALEECWVKLVEAQLRAQGFNVEIANLGKPGIGPPDYAVIAEQAIPLLRPDLVLVAALQTDDLEQSLPNPVFADVLKTGGTGSWRASIRSQLMPILPHLLAAARLRHPQALPWSDAVKRVAATLTSEERTRFDAMAPDLRQLFLTGNLNPGLFALTLKEPDYFLSGTSLSSDLRRRQIDAMARHLERIRAVASRYQTRVAVVSVPYRIYVNSKGVDSTRRLGFKVDDLTVNSPAPDRAFQEASDREGLTFLTATGYFRDRCKDSVCYFDLDDHFNAAGHRAFAAGVTPLIARLANLQTRFPVASLKLDR